MFIPDLSDTTIYEMEQRGEFRKCFFLTSRCVVWDLAEVETWLDERRRASEAEIVRKAAPPDVRQRRARPVKGTFQQSEAVTATAPTSHARGNGAT